MHAEVARTPFAVKARYRYGEGGESKDANFYGLFFDRSEGAVLGRLKEAHRFAAWVEVVELRWRGEDGDAAAAREGARRGRPPHGARHGLAGGDGPGPGTGARESGAERSPGDGRWRVRRHARCGMFKPAQVVLEDAVLDCVLLDVSPGGAQVCLLAHADLPDLAVLRLPCGESRHLRRRWQRGSRVGFETVDGAAAPS